MPMNSRPRRTSGWFIQHAYVPARSRRSGPSAARSPARRKSGAVLSEAVAEVIARDPAPEAGALAGGVAEVEAGEDPRESDVADRVGQAAERAGRAGHPAVERERDPVGAEEGLQGGDDRAAVAGVRRRIFRVVRRRAERLEPRDGLIRAPGPVVVLGVEAGDDRVG